MVITFLKVLTSTNKGTSMLQPMVLQSSHLRGPKSDHMGMVIDEESDSLDNEMTDYCLSIFDPHGNKIHTVLQFQWPHRSYARPLRLEF